MSLHTLAHHLQSAGRGDDKVLVHMTPKEVSGLQSLAMAHGGSLTINPETGLPEAGFLSSILPMVAGFFLGPAGLGLTAMQSALTVGALGTAATGSLGKGFMMGLGAYGGAGLGEGLSSVGAANIPTGTAGETAANLGSQGSAFNIPADKFAPSNFGAGTAGTTAEVVAKTAAESGGLSGIQPFANPNVMAANPYGVANPYNLTPTVSAPVNLGTVSPPSISSNLVNAGDFAATPNMASSLDVAKSGLNTADAGIKYGTDIAETMRNTPTPVNDIDAIMSRGTPPSSMDKLGAGFNRATGSWEGAKEVWNATPKGTGYGLAATGMSVLQAQQEEAAEDARRAAEAAAAERGGYMRPYDYSTEQVASAYEPSSSTAERGYFVEPRFTARDVYKVKDGGLMSLQKYAVGGPVEEMSAQNAVGENMMYPQSQLHTSMYSNPMVQRPMPTDVIQSGIDTPVNTYTGEQKFALGGSATASAKAKEPSSDVRYAFDPATQQYTQTTTNTPADTTRYSKTGFPIDSFAGFYAPVLAGLGSGIGTIGSGLAGGLGGAAMNPMLGTFYKNQQTTPQPTVSTQTVGGTSTPYTPTGLEAAVNAPMVPNIDLQPRQKINEQLGLDEFYPMMEKELALRGAKMKEQGYADGGSTSYSYDPKTQEYTGTTSKPAPLPQAADYGTIAKYILGTTVGGIGNLLSKSSVENNRKVGKDFINVSKEFLPAPIVTKEVSGGVQGKIVQPQQQATQNQTFVPNIQIREKQNPAGDQFYQMMNDRFAGYQGYAMGGMANGGYNLGSYSDGGRLLRGPGDGVSDSIPASIGAGQPARLADGEFVVPARIVSEIGNGSTEAGARKLYAMMDRVQKARRKTVGKGKVAVNTKADKLLPA